MNSKFVPVLIVLTLILVLAVILPLGMAPNNVSSNYKNVTVRTQVNITNSRPEVLNVTVSEAVNVSNRNITINAGGLKDVTCNATLRDWNGYTDITLVNVVNATLWNTYSSTLNSSDDNATHYTNMNCTNAGNGAGFYVNYICNFTVVYYANNGSWMCNVIVMDTQNTTGFGNGSTIFYPVYALNITDGIDYGGVPAQDFSGNVTANLSNFGNMPINVTVEAYGAKRGDGLAMNCSLGGNITVVNERFSTTAADWSSKTPMTGGLQLLPNLTLSKQINSTVIVNSTYWQLYIDSANNPGGNCTGYIIFTAAAP